MTIPDTLSAAGIANHRRGRFLAPPSGTYAVWFDHIDTDGPDGMPPCIFHHDVTIELYESAPDDIAEAALEAQLSAQGRHWVKQDRYWLSNEQRYQVIYTFAYTETRRM